MASNEFFVLKSMSSLSTISTEHDLINLVDDTDYKVVGIEKFYLPIVLTISLASMISSSSSVSSTLSESSINSSLPFYNINAYS